MTTCRLVIIIVVTAFLSLTLKTCSPGSSETGNAFTISGRISSPDKSVASVTLVPEDYNPFDSDSGILHTTITDATGFYLLTNVPEGAYFLEATDSLKKYGRLRGPLLISDKNVELGTDTLKEFSSIIVSIDTLPFKSGLVGVYIKGTTNYSYVNDTSRYVYLENVPYGTMDIMQVNTDKTLSYVDSLAVPPGDTITVSRRNRPPVVVSAVSDMHYLFTIDSLYVDTILARDPDGDPVRYWTVSAPPVFSIDSITGIITWLPSADSVSSYQCGVRVTDTQGAGTSFWWTVETRNNRNPVAPAAPSGPATFQIDSTCTFSADTCNCLSSPSLYVFYWGDGDTSKSASPVATHVFKKSGTFSIRTQILCTDYKGPSELSASHNIYIYKSRVSESPVPYRFSYTVTNYDSLVIQLRPIQCDSNVLYRYTVDNKEPSGWSHDSAFTFMFTEPGLHTVRFEGWCDSNYTYPSPLSDPCSVFVDETTFLRAPRPYIVKDSISSIDTLSDTLIIMCRVIQDSCENGNPCVYRFSASSYDTTGWNSGSLYMLKIFKNDSNPMVRAQARCMDDSTGETESEWSVLHVFP